MILIGENINIMSQTIGPALDIEPLQTMEDIFGWFGTEPGAGLPDLEELAADESAEVRRAAVFALGQLGEAAAERALRRAVGDPDRRTGTLAIEAMGKIGARLATVFEVGRRLSDIQKTDDIVGDCRAGKHNGSVTARLSQWNDRNFIAFPECPQQ